MADPTTIDRGPAIGVLLPHFSDDATPDRLFGFAGRIEELGFDSVWVRDNLSFERHGFERAGRFIDPFVTLSVIAGLTTRITLGTAVTVPFRHPLVTAQMIGSLAWASGGRVELGVGPGTPRKPFDLVGVDYDERIIRCRESVEVIRAVAAGPHAGYHGRTVEFEDASIDPPPPQDLMVWYGGGSAASVRRAVRYCDGIQPGLCPFPAWDRVAGAARDAAERAGRTLKVGAIPLISLGRTKEQAIARVTDAVAPLCAFLGRYYDLPLAGPADLDGALLAGTADDLGEALARYTARGADLVVLDARLMMAEFEDVIEEVGATVLPRLRPVTQ
ncbi:MAG TPA: LLM class flavin-dependent oxidoreductase [Micromonosporaceae bacterium]|jgi:alkanesulfonate monooxygenase SsuD/methylene tetrahydromethanopterin reductase-like flavin-dependent oxidoreductase (luciferase family)